MLLEGCDHIQVFGIFAKQLVALKIGQNLNLFRNMDVCVQKVKIHVIYRRVRAMKFTLKTPLAYIICLDL